MDLNTRLGVSSVVPMGRARKEGPTTICQWDSVAHAEVPCEQGARNFGLLINQNPSDNEARIFIVRENQYVDALRPNYPFTVPVQWKGDSPKTRERGKDNVDLFILQKDGRFVDVQVGLITRDKRFFLTMQRVWEGQVVRTRKSITADIEWGFVPTRAIHAYPGARFETIWSSVADAVLGEAKDSGSSVPKSEVVRIPEWIPAKLPRVNGGMMAGTVEYCNMITGTGQVLGSDGVEYFFHFNDIKGQDNRPIRMLEPMKSVVFRPKDTGHRRPHMEGAEYSGNSGGKVESIEQREA